jgi:hypothetical protein
VRGPKYVVTRGKTPVLSGKEMRQLLNSIDTGELIGDFHTSSPQLNNHRLRD